jgi:hypothetical protein
MNSNVLMVLITIIGISILLGIGFFFINIMINTVKSHKDRKK